MRGQTACQDAASTCCPSCCPPKFRGVRRRSPPTLGEVRPPSTVLPPRLDTGAVPPAYQRTGWLVSAPSAGASIETGGGGGGRNASRSSGAAAPSFVWNRMFPSCPSNSFLTIHPYPAPARLSLCHHCMARLAEIAHLSRFRAKTSDKRLSEGLRKAPWSVRSGGIPTSSDRTRSTPTPGSPPAPTSPSGGSSSAYLGEPEDRRIQDGDKAGIVLPWRSHRSGPSVRVEGHRLHSTGRG